MVKILFDSVDSDNCWSIIQFADRLQLHALFEEALSYMIALLGNIEEHAAWQDLSAHLQQRLVNIKKAISSGALTNDKKRLFFANTQEYLAIFEETVQYHRDRLNEAKLRQTETPENTNSWRYAQRNIEKQERFVKGLEAVMAEHQTVFAPKSKIDCHMSVKRKRS
eukprot:CAMPEP_0116574804 /NCGR_PEP_ID=MMETSP0397-20121206/19602_1 /TAXON_ID=216820 /ORGANISM="Cyclophora tenuis, Strain ECT3854" /LENGTH=165 /DNA_ID=CAMNT_0004103619 /DNA_START=24 /DNA_END=521 /DNA_ORIENTATION=+